MEKNLLFYLDASSRSFPNSTENYVARVFKERHPGLNVSFSTEPDISRSEGMDAIFYRFDPPYDPCFLKSYDDHLSENPLVIGINPPRSVVSGNKRNLLQFVGSGVVVDSVVSADPVVLASFASGVGKVIAKPLDGYAGNGIFVVDPRGLSSYEVEDAFFSRGGGLEDLLVQRFIDDVVFVGDKRLNVLFYEPVSASLRLPKDGSYLCNEQHGKGFFKADVTDRDREIVSVVRPYLESMGARWAGLDIIGPYLSEINLSCPGFCQADQLHGNDVTKKYLLERLRSYDDA